MREYFLSAVRLSLARGSCLVPFIILPLAVDKKVKRLPEAAKCKTRGKSLALTQLESELLIFHLKNGYLPRQTPIFKPKKNEKISGSDSESINLAFFKNHSILRYFLHIAYNGTNYRGWQRQPTAISVQQILEETISKMLGEKTICVGCGRTDAEVHASKYFVHIEVGKDFTYNPVERLNRMLPNDIAIFDCVKMPARAHTQFDATSRTYEYRMHGRKNPFLRELSAYYPLSELNFEEMKKVVDLFPNHKDYRAFCKTPDIYPTTICRVESAELIVDDKREYAIFRITSNRFLRGMIRLLVGNMILVGQGRMSFSTFENHLKTRVSPKFYTAAHPQGLYLSDVQYPFAELQHLSDKTVFPALLF